MKPKKITYPAKVTKELLKGVNSINRSVFLNLLWLYLKKNKIDDEKTIRFYLLNLKEKTEEFKKRLKSVNE